MTPPVKEVLALQERARELSETLRTAGATPPPMPAKNQNIGALHTALVAHMAELEKLRDATAAQSLAGTGTTATAPGAKLYDEYNRLMESGQPRAASGFWEKNKAALLAYAQDLEDAESASARTAGNSAVESNATYAEYERLMQTNPAEATRYWHDHKDELEALALND